MSTPEPTAAEGSWQERAERAEAQLERLRHLGMECRELASSGFPSYAAVASDILAIIGTETDGGVPYDRDIDSPGAAAGDPPRPLPAADAQPRPSTTPVTDRAVDLALAASVTCQSAAPREAVWVSPSRRQARAMLEAAAPVIADGGRERADARLAEVREVISTYFAVHANSSAVYLVQARDLAEGIRQVLDRKELRDG